MRVLLIIFISLFSLNSYASQITTPTIWNNGDTVTAAKLNGNQNAITNVVNGDLDNGNMASGYRLFQVFSTLPAAGNQGNVGFLTSNNTLNIDNGATWQATITPSGTLATGQLPYYNGGWQLLSPGAQYYSLISNGMSSLPSYQQINLANGVTSTLPIANGGTNATTAQTAIDNILPSQISNSGKFLTTNGTTSSWGNPTSPALVWISTISISGAATTGNINITSGNTYFVQFNFINPTGSADLLLRFNADSGSDYKYSNLGLQAGSATVLTKRSTGTTSISLTANGMLQSSTSGTNGSFYIQQLGSASQIYRIWGNTSYDDNSGNIANATLSGSWFNTANIVSFVVLPSTGNITGTVYLYQVVNQ